MTELQQAAYDLWKWQTLVICIALWEIRATEQKIVQYFVCMILKS